jgi:hypothetical protein
MKQLSELKEALREAVTRMDAYFTVERLKDDFFNKYLQQQETSLYVYDVDTFPDKEEKVPVSIHDAFIKAQSRLNWDCGGYTYAAIAVEITGLNEEGEQALKCKTVLFYNHEVELNDADYYKASDT